jgi:3-phenylpropionate/trans-cinnamate dioxygenase ferredoxin reductase component
VTLIGAEKDLPYERPPLSKAYLRGDVPFDKALVRPAAFYTEHGIETMFGTRATRIDPSGRFVELDDHRRVPFDTLLVATGGATGASRFPEAISMASTGYAPSRMPIVFGTRWRPVDESSS